MKSDEKPEDRDRAGSRRGSRTYSCRSPDGQPPWADQRRQSHPLGRGDGVGNPGWSFEDVLPYFRKLESNVRGGGPYHGADGPMKVSDCEFQFPISNVFVDAARQTGMPITDECPSVGGRWSLSTHDRKRSPVRRGLDPVELAQLPLDVPRAHPAGVHRDDLVVEPGKASLVLGDQLRLKGAAPIPRNLQVHLAGIGDDGLLAVAVAVAVAPLTSTPRVKSWALPFCVLPVPMVPRTGFFGRVAS
jgi:choline dehydrogenase-like flavoprotein